MQPLPQTTPSPLRGDRGTYPVQTAFKTGRLRSRPVGVSRSEIPQKMKCRSFLVHFDLILKPPVMEQRMALVCGATLVAAPLLRASSVCVAI